jgi:hypothetical protein
MKTVKRRKSKRGPADNQPPSPSPEEAPSKSSGLDELRSEYRRLHHSEAPRLSRDLLVRAIEYRRQEIDHGGLGKSDTPQVADDRKGPAVDWPGGSDSRPQLEAGSTLGARMARPHAHGYRDGRRI